MSFRLRLALIYTALLATALLIFSGLLYSVLRWTYIQSVDDSLERVGGRVAFDYRFRGVLPSLNSLADRSTFVQVRGSDFIYAQSGNLSGLFPLPPQAELGEPVFTYEVNAQGERYRLYTLPIVENGTLRFYVQSAYTIRLLTDATDRMLWPLVLGTLIFVGLGALGSFWAARRAIAPIMQVARAARTIGDSAELTLRVPSPKTGDEVEELVDTFNNMLDRLEALYGKLAAAVSAQQRFVADASHELRTPLTIIRGNIDYIQKTGHLDTEALSDMATEAERMTRLIEELLTAARADASQVPELSPISLGPILSEACRAAMGLPREVEFRTELPAALDRVVVFGNAEWLTRLLLILIDNAFKYTPTGRVTVQSGRQGDGVVVQVIDTGIGIAPESLPHIFDRFYRADVARTRGGTGLGLAIARWISTVHGGSISVQSELGKGSRFSLWLPLHRPVSTPISK